MKLPVLSEQKIAGDEMNQRHISSVQAPTIIHRLRSYLRRIHCLHTVLHRIILPCLTSLVHNIEVNQTYNLIFPFQKLQCKSFFGVPTNMTMHQPHTRIVSLERNYQVPIGMQQCCIASRWVNGVRHAIKCAVSLCKDIKVMTV